MNKNDQACAYLQAMAANLGADVVVYPSVDGKGGRFTMCLRSSYPTDKRVQVSLEDRSEVFEAKVRELMGGSNERSGKLRR